MSTFKNVQVVPFKSEEFTPKNELILVKPADKETEKTTDAGIIIPLMDKSVVTSRQTFGEVVSVGKEIDDISVGDTVFWTNTDGIDFEFTDGEFMLLRYKSIIGSI